MLLIFVACDDEQIKNEQISNDNVTKMKLLQETAEVEKQDIVVDNTERLNKLETRYFRSSKSVKHSMILLIFIPAN